MRLLLTISIILLFSSLNFAQGYWEKYWDFKKHSNLDSNSTFTEYYKNGTIKLTGKYISGIPDGTWNYYDKDGVKIIETNYNGSHKYYLKGDFYSVGQTGTYINGKRSGIWTEGRGAKITENKDTVLIIAEQYDFNTGLLILSRPYTGKYRKTIKIDPEKYVQREKNEGQVCYSIITGIQKISLIKLNNELKPNDTTQSLTLKSIGLGLDNNGAYNRLTVSIRYQMFNETFNEPLKGKYKGSYLKLTFGHDFIRQRFLDIIVNAGLGYGKFKIIDQTTYKRNWLLADFGISQKFNIKPASSNYMSRNGFSIGFDAGYLYDILKSKEISNTKWKTSLNGLYFYFVIAYSIIDS